MCKCVCGRMLSFLLGRFPGVGFLGPMEIFYVLRSCQMVFRSGCIVLHSHPQGMSDPLVFDLVHVLGGEDVYLRMLQVKPTPCHLPVGNESLLGPRRDARGASARFHISSQPRGSIPHPVALSSPAPAWLATLPCSPSRSQEDSLLYIYKCSASHCC